MESQEPMQEVFASKSVRGRTVLSFKLPTPVWATYLFRLEFIINKGLMMYFAGTSHLIHDLQEKILILTIIDFMVWSFARSIGIEKQDLGLDDNTA